MAKKVGCDCRDSKLLRGLEESTGGVFNICAKRGALYFDSINVMGFACSAEGCGRDFCGRDT